MSEQAKKEIATADEDGKQSIREKLEATAKGMLLRHAVFAGVGVFPAVLLVRTHAERKLTRLLLASFVLCYYPLLGLFCSLTVPMIWYLLQQTAALRSLLERLVELVTEPLRKASGAQSREQVSGRLRMGAKHAHERETGFVRGVVWFLLRVVRRVLEVRFGKLGDDRGVISAEALTRVAAGELVGLVVAPVRQMLFTWLLSIVFGAAACAAAPFLLLRLFGKIAA